MSLNGLKYYFNLTQSIQFDWREIRPSSSPGIPGNASWILIFFDFEYVFLEHFRSEVHACFGCVVFFLDMLVVFPIQCIEIRKLATYQPVLHILSLMLIMVI
jgi:hypothetical protein